MRLGRDNNVVATCLEMYRSGRWTWDRAVLEMVVHLAAALETTRDALVNCYQHRVDPVVIPPHGKT